jgi:hypothetical protein
MGQLVQGGFIDLATLEERQLLYHILRNARIEPLEDLVGIAVAGAAEQQQKPDCKGCEQQREGKRQADVQRSHQMAGSCSVAQNR